MADLSAAIAAARENRAALRHAKNIRDEDIAASKCIASLDAILAAIDAAHGEAVATVVLRGDRYGHGHFIEAQLQIDPTAELPQGTKLYAAPPAAVPAGYVLVPVEPTGAMVVKGADGIRQSMIIRRKPRETTYQRAARNCWGDMLAAANKENNNG